MRELALPGTAGDAYGSFGITDFIANAVEMVSDFPRHAMIVGVERGRADRLDRIHVEHGSSEALVAPPFEYLDQLVETLMLRVLIDQKLIGIDIDIPPVRAVAVE